METRLLLVDDHRMMREGLRALLEMQNGFEVIGEAEDGREAVRLAKSLRPDVIIMDLGMKEMNGVEATRQLQSDCPKIPIVVLSTYSSEDHVLTALEAGATAYVLKISAPEELVKAVECATRGQRFLSPEITRVVVEAGLQGARTDRNSTRRLLTGREREVLQLVAEGHTSGEIASRLHLATRTVEQHRRRIMEKLDRHSIAALTQYAIREGLVALEESSHGS